MKKIFKITSNILMYAFFVVMLSILILSFVGIKPYVTMSGSMEPSIQTGSICFVNTNEKYENIKTNDVIAFNANNNMLVTHRVNSFTDAGIQTKGDNNEEPDLHITNENNFVGKTLFSVPYIGYCVMFLKKPICLGIIASILFVLVFLNIKDAFSSKKEKAT